MCERDHRPEPNTMSEMPVVICDLAPNGGFATFADRLLAEALELDPFLRDAPNWPTGPTWQELA